MVSKVEEAMKLQIKQQQQQQHQKDKQIMGKERRIKYCNKGKLASKFKRSTSNLQEDGLSSAILLLACIAFSS